QDRTAADSILRRDDPAGEGPAVDPLLLIGDSSGENVCYKNKNAAYSKRKETIQSSSLNAPAAIGARAVEGKSTEMLRREMVCHPRVIDNRQSNQPLLTRPWQRRVARQKYGKACCCYCKREYDKS